MPEVLGEGGGVGWLVGSGEKRKNLRLLFKRSTNECNP